MGDQSFVKDTTKDFFVKRGSSINLISYIYLPFIHNFNKLLLMITILEFIIL